MEIVKIIVKLHRSYSTYLLRNIVHQMIKGEMQAVYFQEPATRCIFLILSIDHL